MNLPMSYYGLNAIILDRMGTTQPERTLASVSAQLFEPVFANVWDSSEEDVYNELSL